MSAENSRKWREDGLVPPLDRTRTIPIPSRRCRSDAQTAAAAVALKPIRDRPDQNRQCKTHIIKVHHLHRRNIQDTDKLRYCYCFHYISRSGPSKGGKKKRVQNRRRIIKQTTYSV